MGKSDVRRSSSERLRAKLQRFDDRMRKVQETSEKRRQHMLFDARRWRRGDRFAGQQLVEVRVMREGKRKLARISGPGYGSSAQVKLPTHLNKRARCTRFQPVLCANRVPIVLRWHRQRSLRTQKPEKPATSSQGGREHKMLGKVPGSIYHRVLKQGSAFALIYGSQWSKDGVHNKGDGHVPKREHITLDSEDIARLTQILVDYGIEPLKGRNDHAVFGSALYFSPIDVDERIGRALVRTIFPSTARFDAGTYADAVALRAATSRTLSDVETIATSLAHVQSIGRTYAWSRRMHDPMMA